MVVRGRSDGRAAHRVSRRERLMMRKGSEGVAAIAICPQAKLLSNNRFVYYRWSTIDLATLSENALAML
jgi:hypothetical protein